MARSKSPKKTPTKAKAAQVSSPLDDPNVQLGVGVAILVALQIAANGPPTSPKARIRVIRTRLPQTTNPPLLLLRPQF